MNFSIKAIFRHTLIMSHKYSMTDLPGTDASGGLGKRSLEETAELEGVRSDLSNVVKQRPECC